MSRCITWLVPTAPEIIPATTGATTPPIHSPQAGVNDVALATSDSGTDSLGITELQIAITPLMKQDAPANASVCPRLESGSSTNAA